MTDQEKKPKAKHDLSVNIGGIKHNFNKGATIGFDEKTIKRCFDPSWLDYGEAPAASGAVTFKKKKD